MSLEILTAEEWNNYTPQQKQAYRKRLFITRPNDRHVCIECGQTVGKPKGDHSISWSIIKELKVGNKKEWVTQPNTSVCLITGGDHVPKHTPWVIDGEKIYLDSPAIVDYQAALLAYYRIVGFPHFHLDDDLNKRKEFKAFLKTKYKGIFRRNNSGVRELNQSMAGVGLAWVYHPHHWSVQCNNMKTCMEVFEDDKLFMKAIKKRMQYGVYLRPAGIRKSLGTFTGTQRCSNFRPTAAAAIYDAFLPDKGGVVWDPSCGFGGRLLGAMLCDKVTKYLGTDPATATFHGLEQMRDELLPMLKEFTGRELVVDIYQEGSEVDKPWIEKGSVDLCFTSPPYFNCEKYSNEDSQSYKQFPTPNEWLNGFMKRTLANCHKALHNDGTLVINLAGVKSAPNLAIEFCDMAKNNGWVLVEEAKLLLAKMMGTRNNDDNAFKSEPVFVFKKRT